MLAEELSRRGMSREFYSYEGLKHYFSTSADTPQARDDTADILGFAGLPAQVTARELMSSAVANPRGIRQLPQARVQ